jgi:hypothetical protein
MARTEKATPILHLQGLDSLLADQLREGGLEVAVTCNEAGQQGPGGELLKVPVDSKGAAEGQGVKG